MKKIILFLAIGYVVFTWNQGRNSIEGSLGEYHDELIMYSLTTCGYCKKKARELKKQNIPFIEYYVDEDAKRKEELANKLKKAGIQARSYGTPIFDAYGTMLPNNPSISKIKDAKAKTLETKGV